MSKQPTGCMPGDTVLKQLNFKVNSHGPGTGVYKDEYDLPNLWFRLRMMLLMIKC